VSLLHCEGQAKAADFYVRIPGGKLIRSEDPCYMRDPDGYIIEVGQYTQLAIDWFNSQS
jgi:hypothetical protein